MSRAPTSFSSAWFELARSSFELMQGSAEVITRRTSAMAAPGVKPTAAQEREARRMVDEKVSASAESLTRMGFAAAAAYQSMWTSTILGRAPIAAQLQLQTAKVIGAGMQPFKKKVRGNVRRLRK